MNLILRFRDEMLGFSLCLVSQFEQLIIRLNTWGAREHTVDGAHTNITAASLTATGAILSSGSGIGYTTGAGGTVAQATSKATGVTLNALSGTITTNNAALAAGAVATFALTNSWLATGDVLVVNHVSGGTAGAYLLNAQCGSESASINVRNVTAGSLSEAVAIQFAVVKGANS